MWVMFLGKKNMVKHISPPFFQLDVGPPGPSRHLGCASNAAIAQDDALRRGRAGPAEVVVVVGWKYYYGRIHITI